MKTASILFALVVSSLTAAHGATGMFGSYIQVNTTVYDAQSYGGPVNNVDFDGFNFGQFAPGVDTLSITNASGLTFKNGGGDVTGVTMFYRVYKVGDTAGSFIAQALNFGNNAPNTDLGGNSFSGGGDQEWKGLTGGGSVNLLALATAGAGNYKAEVFFRASTNEGDRFSNNGGANFTGLFSIPEPSRALLVMIGMMGCAIRRRRK